jgi:hypothetical protein
MTRARLALLAVSPFVASLAHATEPAPAAAAAPAPAPEIKKTVDALAGKWTMNVAMTLPGQPAPVKFPEKFDCKKSAGGRAVTCVDTAKVPGMGPVDFTHLVAYDAERKAVHWFAVGSTGEVHDHVCHWKDDKVLDCEPLKATMDGNPITETFSVTVDGNTVKVASTTTTKDGPVKVEATGKRGG